MRGGVQQLTGGYYDLTVNPGSVKAYLPFYGRAQTIPIGASDGGIKFTAQPIFNMKLLQKNKSWRITIRTNDVYACEGNYTLPFMTMVMPTLDVMNINRDDISYNGCIR